MADQRVEIVERQLQAYNAHQVDAFVACFAEGAVVEDADGNALMIGREQLRVQYEQLFSGFPDLRAEVVTRISVGAFVVDEERLTDGPFGDRADAVAIYRVDGDGLIGHVRFLS